MPLDLSTLKNSIEALETAVNVSKDPATLKHLKPPARNVLRAGVIQNFELAYELSWKFIQRWIRVNKSPAEAEPRTRKDLFRHAARYKLIANPESWFRFSDARNQSVHTYSDAEAEKISSVAADFISAAKLLLKQLESHNE